MRLEVVNPHVTPLTRVTGITDDSPGRPWQPGDMCYVWQRPKCTGTVVSIQDDENLLVLWSVVPDLNAEEKASNQMACQIRDEIDADILHDLHAAGMVSKKTLLEKFGLPTDEHPTDV